MKLYVLDKDEVVEGFVVSAVCEYRFALDHLAPLIGRLNIQRDTLKTKFYARLEKDIVKGCVMPPITVALIHEFPGDADKQHVFDYIISNVDQGFVLDGIQRLNTLAKASLDDGFDPKRPLHVNFVIASSRDKLLYRMITLNNGQRPMSARHQIEVLADAFFDFDGVDLKLVAEKGKSRVRAPDSFKKSDFVKGYIAYLGETVNVDNQKIIEEKMDELIASRIIESDIPSRRIEFADVVGIVNRMSEDEYLRDWIRVQNNFIGFCVGSKSSIDVLASCPNPEMRPAIEGFESAFSSVNVSKVNLGKVRRECVSKFIENFADLRGVDEFELLNRISDWI
ncbi:hypothetical protein A7X93_14995 [Stenotrophomonas maltophilia]|uniref:hypothetical protein n=1 Tax=Stenotrophomonas maltophilia TaxID=40324 RepID=UPI000DA93E60|nr:hypothetical protein [Stenotrophomonas maltophilia]PZT29627.1 hypothetical protein A7X93_14995 [Stenotrophomonas maltophilia]